MKAQKQKAVTLMEILIVIIIIGVIIAFGIPQYENAIRAARQKSVNLCLTLIQDAQSLYFDDNGFYFPDPSGLAQPGLLPINSNLGLNITGDIIYFTCAPSGMTDFQCSGTYPQPPAAAQWCCHIHKTGNPTCNNSGACP